MKFKVVSWNTNCGWAVVREDDDTNAIALCPLKDSADLIAGALNLRKTSLKKLAQGFIEAVDNGEGKLKDRWIGLVKGQQLTTNEAKELWDEVLEAIHRREEMVVT